MGESRLSHASASVSVLPVLPVLPASASVSEFSRSSIGGSTVNLTKQDVPPIKSSVGGLVKVKFSHLDAIASSAVRSVLFYSFDWFSFDRRLRYLEASAVKVPA